MVRRRRSSQTSRSCHRHFRRSHKRMGSRPIFIRQCSKPSKACTGRLISTKDGERCALIISVSHRHSYHHRPTCVHCEHGRPLPAPLPAPSAMVLTSLTGPREAWAHHPNGSRMRSGTLPNGEPQAFYFPEDHPSMPGWFKGMEIIIRERDLWPAEGDLLAQCPGFRCPPSRADCCCRRILFSQPDFVSQKSQLQELVESRGHLCDFYPKYHCELNFIEQYWGAAKLRFRMAGRAATIDEMERKVITCLDDVPLLHVRR
jgi:hypothetical protein